MHRLLRPNLAWVDRVSKHLKFLRNNQDLISISDLVFQGGIVPLLDKI